MSILSDVLGALDALNFVDSYAFVNWKLLLAQAELAMMVSRKLLFLETSLWVVVDMVLKIICLASADHASLVTGLLKESISLKLILGVSQLLNLLKDLL